MRISRIAARDIPYLAMCSERTSSNGPKNSHCISAPQISISVWPVALEGRSTARGPDSSSESSMNVKRAFLAGGSASSASRCLIMFVCCLLWVIIWSNCRRECSCCKRWPVLSSRIKVHSQQPKSWSGNKTTLCGNSRLLVSIVDCGGESYWLSLESILDTLGLFKLQHLWQSLACPSCTNCTSRFASTRRQHRMHKIELTLTTDYWCLHLIDARKHRRSKISKNCRISGNLRARLPTPPQDPIH
ncbi:hypothetical protein BDR26DRAFT_872543 [Obelidium mucronatum]|nr:hypothetical protein BDR26DRAFT_872543 [Obelidium mucronatum]